MNGMKITANVKQALYVLIVAKRLMRQLTRKQALQNSNLVQTQRLQLIQQHLQTIYLQLRQQENRPKGALGHTQNADDGDCTTAVTCKRCDYVFIPAKEHDFSGEWKSDQTGHWKVCKNDGCTKVDKKAHTANITEPTENEDQICTECGWIIANKLGHLHKRHLEYVKAKRSNMYRRWK